MRVQRSRGVKCVLTGDHALAAVRNSDGLAIGVKDEDVFVTQRQIGAKEGIRTEPAGAAPVATFRSFSPWERFARTNVLFVY